jgi:hypothetical protein
MNDPDHEGGTMTTDDLTLSRRGLIGVLGGGVASVAFGARDGTVATWMKVHVGSADRVVHTGQVFFSEAIASSVYRSGAYAGRGQADTSHAEDSIYAQAGGSRAVAKLSRRPGGARGYVGRIVIGVATT